MNSVRMLAIVLAALAIDAAADGIQISTVARDGRVYVSCALDDQVMADVDEAIQSGLATTISYEADLRRSVSVWLDRTLASSTVTAAVQRDTLTGRYQISRSVDGRLEDSRVTDDKTAMRQFVMAFDRLPLFSAADLEPNVEYYVRVRVRTRPRVTWFFWPWDRPAASGIARFTFIP
jgi:Domain of unknown function (DUF4390)